MSSTAKKYPQQRYSANTNHANELLKIVWLRFAMLSVASFVIWFFSHVLERELQVGLLLGVIIAGFAYGLATLARLKRKIPVSATELMLHLCIDAIMLILLVAFSGGATNPFIYYYLVLVGIASALFRQSLAWAFCVLAIFAYSALLLFDLRDHAHHSFSDFQLHLVGMWFNFVGSATLMCVFVSRLATTLRDREVLLAEARQINLKNEHLVGIGTIAASTAHNLGTPLSTMAMVLDDFDKDASDDEIDNDIALLTSQIAHCKSILDKLVLLAEQEHSTLAVKDYVEQIKEHYLLANPTLQPQFSIAENAQLSELSADVLLQHALINLIDNAIRAASTKVLVDVNREANTLTITIKDDGSGLPAEVLENWGNPVAQKKSNGLGLGVFLANYTIEKIGGSVSALAKNSDNMTHIVVELPISQ